MAVSATRDEPYDVPSSPQSVPLGTRVSQRRATRGELTNGRKRPSTRVSLEQNVTKRARSVHTSSGTPSQTPNPCEFDLDSSVHTAEHAESTRSHNERPKRDVLGHLRKQIEKVMRHPGTEWDVYEVVRHLEQEATFRPRDKTDKLETTVRDTLHDMATRDIIRTKLTTDDKGNVTLSYCLVDGVHEGDLVCGTTQQKTPPTRRLVNDSSCNGADKAPNSKDSERSRDHQAFRVCNPSDSLVTETPSPDTQQRVTDQVSYDAPEDLHTMLLAESSGSVAGRSRKMLEQLTHIIPELQKLVDEGENSWTRIEIMARTVGQTKSELTNLKEQKAFLLAEKETFLRRVTDIHQKISSLDEVAAHQQEHLKKEEEKLAEAETIFKNEEATRKQRLTASEQLLALVRGLTY
ncbi:hypothetical protein LTR86_010421 [Recurvomyces mirabilis]|nr:hypothetical protein LTR86_010421 [Recurvomyces mirabilis]